MRAIPDVTPGQSDRIDPETLIVEQPDGPTGTQQNEWLLISYLRTDGVLIDDELTTDKDLLAAGWRACELLEAGGAHDAIDVSEGDVNDRAIAVVASQVICDVDVAYTQQ